MAVNNWEAVTDQGNFASTVLDSLATATLSSAGSEFNNSTAEEKYGIIEVVLGSFNASATNPYIEIYLTYAPDGTNYEDAPAIAALNVNTLVSVLAIKSGTSTKRVVTKPFLLMPFKCKPYIGNVTGGTFAASGNEINIYTTNDELV